MFFTPEGLQKLAEGEEAESVVLGCVTSAIGIPPIFREELAAELSNDNDVVATSGFHTSDSDEEGKRKKKFKVGYKPREYIERNAKETSSWFQRYLSAEGRLAIETAEEDSNSLHNAFIPNLIHLGLLCIFFVKISLPLTVSLT